MQLKYNRILLKLSGEALMGNNHFGISTDAINNYVAEISAIHNIGVQIGIVVGGGNFYRGINEKETGIKKLSGDKMGMLATVMNAIALKDVFEHFGIDAEVMTAVYMPQFADVFNRDNAIRQMDLNRICIFSGGTSNPLFTTDSAAALRAIEINADLLIKATNVDGVYNFDPKKDSNAKMFDEISYEKCIEMDLKVMDKTAFVLCQENNMPIIVTNIHKKGNLLKVITGENIGTMVK
jgi:uridylate kinase